MIESPTTITVSYPAPPAAGSDRTDKWEQASTFHDFLKTAEENLSLWEGNYRRADIPEDILARIEGLDGNWKLLILSADWCGDASNIVPVFQALVEKSDKLDLRVLDRDEHLDLMSEHLTEGTAQSIPVFIILDEQNIEHAWWGPRPLELQEWVKSEGQKYDKDGRYKELRKWYARDKGRTSMDEVISLIEQIG